MPIPNHFFQSPEPAVGLGEGFCVGGGLRVGDGLGSVDPHFSSHSPLKRSQLASSAAVKQGTLHCGTWQFSSHAHFFGGLGPGVGVGIGRVGFGVGGGRVGFGVGGGRVGFGDGGRRVGAGIGWIGAGDGDGAAPPLLPPPHAQHSFLKCGQ